VLTQDCKVVWYGKLKLESGATPVIFDPLLVPSIKGCIYLYNLERDDIIQYSWKIVQKLLIDVDKAEKAAIKKSIDTKWKSARRRFTKGKVQALTRGYSAPAPPPSPPRPVESVQGSNWDAIDEDSFELDDLD
jgi:hypothetical protein